MCLEAGWLDLLFLCVTEKSLQIANICMSLQNSQDRHDSRAKACEILVTMECLSTQKANVKRVFWKQAVRMYLWSVSACPKRPRIQSFVVTLKKTVWLMQVGFLWHFKIGDLNVFHSTP